MKADFLIARLIVARLRSNGKLQVGKFGYIHADLCSDRELTSGVIDGLMGFAVYGDKRKKFLTREQALKYLTKNKPKNLKVTAKLDRTGLLHTNNIKDHNKVRCS